MNRKTLDRLVSASGMIVAVALIVLGSLAVIGGNFGRANVRDRLEPQKIQFPPIEAMSEEEVAEVGEFAGQQVTDGVQAEAYSRYIGGHLASVNDGKTYSETSAAAREEGIDPELQAELQGKVETLFRGETLRSILLNAYGWWTVATITLYAGYAAIVAGLLLGVFAILGFRHAQVVAAAEGVRAPTDRNVPAGV